MRLALGRLSLERKSYRGHEEDDAATQQVEMLLEAYFIHMDNTFNRLDTMNEYISDTEVCSPRCAHVPFAGMIATRLPMLACRSFLIWRLTTSGTT